MNIISSLPSTNSRLASARMLSGVAPRPAGGAAQGGLAPGHEESGRDALVGYITNQKTEPLRRDHKKSRTGHRPLHGPVSSRAARSIPGCSRKMPWRSGSMLIWMSRAMRSSLAIRFPGGRRLPDIFSDTRQAASSIFRKAHARWAISWGEADGTQSAPFRLRGGKSRLYQAVRHDGSVGPGAEVTRATSRKTAIIEKSRIPPTKSVWRRRIRAAGRSISS